MDAKVIPVDAPKPMRLLVITMLYEPDVVGIAAIATDLCAGLAERGHDVTVYTAYPFYPEWKLKRETRTWGIEEEVLAGVHVRRHGLFIPSNPSRLLPRVLHELSFPLSLMRSLFHGRRFDAVMAFCPLLGSVAFAAVRKLVRREPLWVNVQDIPTEAGRNLGINRSKILHAAASFAQRFLFNRGEIWSSISPEMVAQLEPLRGRGRELQLCPNWLTGSLAALIEGQPRKTGRAPGERLELLYCGTIGKKQELLKFCQVLSGLDLNFRFRIRGDGGEAAAVRSWVQHGGDARFDYAGLLPEAEFVRSIHEADLFVITEKAGAGFSFLPSKLIPSLSLGTPVLAVADRAGPLGREVSAQDVGILLEWSELGELRDRLCDFHSSPRSAALYQQNCYRHAVGYQRQAAIDGLEQQLARLASRGSRRRAVDSRGEKAGRDQGAGTRAAASAERPSSQ